MAEALSGLVTEIWQAARLLARRPKFFVITVLVLSLGIGMSTALFSVTYDVLLKPLAFRDQNRIVVLWKAHRENASHIGELSYAEFKDWERQSNTFSAMAAMPTTNYGYEANLPGKAGPIELARIPVSARFFDVLGAHAAIGRTFLASDDHIGAQPTVVLSHALWEELFHADSAVVGKTIQLNDQGYTVIGVMPAKFDFPAGTQVWTPLGINSGWMGRGATFLQAIGRLNPGQSLQSAASELAAVIKRVDAQYPEYADPGEFPVVTALPDYVFGNSKPAILLLWAASLLLLAVACFNIISLLVAGALLREREIAVRASLGATRWRLLRQFVAEAMVLSVTAAIAGCFVAECLLALARAVVPRGIPRFASVHVNSLSLLFACGVSIAIAIALGCVPALITMNRNLWHRLAESGARTAGSRRGAFLRRALLGGEAAVTMVLLASAGMIIHNFYDLQHVPLGFAPGNVLTAQIRTPKMDRDQANEFFTQLLDRLRSNSNVEAAGAILLRPFEGTIGWDRQYRATGESEEDALRNPTANLEVITPGYCSAVGTAFLAGRDFTMEDDKSHPNVMIVSAALARREFGSVQQAIGKQIGLARAATPADQDWRTIVGVVADAQYRRMGVRQGDIFLSFLQTGIPVRYLAIRTKTDPMSIAPVLTKDVDALDETLAVSKIQSLAGLIGSARMGPRFSMLLFAMFGAFAGLLACVGAYGLVSDSVVQRRREMGIRMALGAQRQNVLALAMRNEMAAVGLGGCLGLLLSLALAHVYAHMLYGLGGTDYISAGVAFILLCSVSWASSVVPAAKLIGIPIARLLNE
ncbi:MAG: ABC transporter permease [Candidatus Acidiferrales bacterium]